MSLNIPVLPSNRKYWFFRTEGGLYFDEFFSQEFIAYGWDDFIDLEYIKNADKDTFKNDFKAAYEEESRPGLAINQMKLFVEKMKPGDIVFIPSSGSELVAFGVITSDVFIGPVISADDIEAEKCPYRKRRKVNWLNRFERNDVDPYLFRPMCAINAISDATDYAPFIDRMLYPLYIKDGIGHLTLHVNRKDKISARQMAKLINDVIGLIELPSGEEQIANLDDIEVKVNVQSPGPVEFIGYSVAIGVLSVVMGQFVVGGKTKANFDLKVANINWETESEGCIEKILKLREQNHQHAIELKKVMQELEVKLPPQLTAQSDLSNNKTE